jgi:hypothetical protein
MILMEFAHYILGEGAAIAGAGLGGLAVYLARKGYDLYANYKHRNSRAIIPSLLNADVAVYQDLSQLLVETNADRAYVIQFHNGIYYLNQTNNMKLTCTHEVVKEGISRIQDDFKDKLLSKYAIQMSKVLEEHVAVFDVKDEIESYYRSVMESQGTARSVAGIMMDGNIVEGALVINYLEGSPMLEVDNLDFVKARVGKAAEAIGFKLRESR